LFTAWCLLARCVLQVTMTFVDPSLVAARELTAVSEYSSSYALNANSQFRTVTPFATAERSVAPAVFCLSCEPHMA
jgi:hypothetical protein